MCTQEVKVGDMVECRINQSWEGCLTTGGRYRVNQILRTNLEPYYIVVDDHGDQRFFGGFRFKPVPPPRATATQEFVLVRRRNEPHRVFIIPAGMVDNDPNNAGKTLEVLSRQKITMTEGENDA